MTKEQIENSFVLCGYGESISYGTNTKDSDTDIRAIFMPSKEYWIGLRNIGTIEGKEGENKEIDYSYKSIREYFRLAIQANPNILELLWLRENHYLWKKVKFPEIGKKLIANRELFLSKRVRNSYSGYAYSQIKRLDKLNKNVNQNKKRLEDVEKFGFDPKNAAHCMRLMNQGLEILVEGKPEVFRHDAAFLLDIRAGKYTHEQIIKMFEDYQELINQAYVKSDLPADPPFDKIENLLMEIYEETFYS